jgi:hypothetical protein
MPFRLCNVAQKFRRFIDKVLHKLDFCYAYVNEVLIASNTEDKHEEHLRIPFQCFNYYGVLLNLVNSVFGAVEVTSFGYKISADRTRPLKDQVATVNSFQQPVMVKELRWFLGILKFYWRFLPDIATRQDHFMQF